MNPDVLNTILGVSLLVFVITIMLAMGLSLTVGQIVVALQKFSDNANVLTMVIVGGMVGLVILMPLTAQLGRRQET